MPGVFLLKRLDPKAVEIAIFVNGFRSFAIGKNEFSLRLSERVERLQLDFLIRHQNDKGNMMFQRHGMRNGANGQNRIGHLSCLGVLVKLNVHLHILLEVSLPQTNWRRRFLLNGSNRENQARTCRGNTERYRRYSKARQGE